MGGRRLLRRELGRERTGQGPSFRRFDGIDARTKNRKEVAGADKEMVRTPVGAETFKAWKERKAKTTLAEKMALPKAETLKKKGKSVLTRTRPHPVAKKSVFVDDADAAGDYTRAVVEEEGDAAMRTAHIKKMSCQRRTPPTASRPTRRCTVTTTTSTTG